MTDERALELYNELKDHFGDKLPNFEYYPRQFAYYIRLYQYHKTKTNETN